jgi:hypothetical protein
LGRFGRRVRPGSDPGTIRTAASLPVGNLLSESFVVLSLPPATLFACVGQRAVRPEMVNHIHELNVFDDQKLNRETFSWMDEKGK